MKAPTSSSRKTRQIAEASLLLVTALVLSYIESLIPTSSLIPIPGFKLGLANIAIIIAFYRLSPLWAGIISLLRILISSFLFSGITTFLFSLSGAICAFTVLLLMSLIFRSKIGFVGISVLMALSHNFGQLICSSFVLHSKSVFHYFPALTAAALICGGVTGVIMSLLPKNVYSRKVH